MTDLTPDEVRRALALDSIHVRDDRIYQFDKPVIVIEVEAARAALKTEMLAWLVTQGLTALELTGEHVVYVELPE